MKKLGYSLFGLILLVFTSCKQENILQLAKHIQEGDETTVCFSVNIPEYKTLFTRSNGGVNDLHLLVFDENGIFIIRKEATLSEQSENGGKFTVNLPASTHKRVVHFISNYPWIATNDEEMQGVNEAAAIALLSTSQATFWARQELNDGINTTCFNGITVELLRNQAKISVQNQAENFTLTGFTIHSVPDKGTVAPFNRTTSQFQEGVITEPQGLVLTDAIVSDIDTKEKYLFERRNKNAAEITTVIIKGEYDGISCFYKIDLIDTDKIRYNIERNYHYIVKIKNVLKEGYINFDDALAGASHNNTALDPIIEKYPMISDGNSKLEVEKTLIILTEADSHINTWAKYYPDLNNTNFDNTDVNVSIMQNDGEEAIVASSLSFEPSTGVISFTGVSPIPLHPCMANIIIRKEDLARTIRIIIRPPYSFSPITINDRPGPVLIESGQSQNAILRFNIPDEFPDDLLPLQIKIYTQGLYPAAAGLQMFVEEDVIHYIYNATNKGIQTVAFKTNKSGNAEIVQLKADYFTDGIISYGGQNRITYGGINASIQDDTPIPTGTHLNCSKGNIAVISNGIYRYTPPVGANGNSLVTISYKKPSHHEVYQQTVTVNELKGNIDLNLKAFYEFTGSIQYRRSGKWHDVPSDGNVSIGEEEGTIKMTDMGKYRYTIPTADAPNNKRITFKYRRSSTYKQKRTIEELKTNTDLRLTK